MNYYKLIRDESIFGVATSDDLRKHQKKHNIFVRATDAEAEFIQLGDDLYRDKWMRPATVSVGEDVTIRAISEDEYSIIAESLTEGKEPDVTVVDQTPVEIEEPAETVVGEDTVELVRKNKLKELSLACSKAITDGFDLVLGETEHHFSFSMQDQANLLSVHVQILAGATEIPYHADGEESVMYSADEMTEVIHAANAHKTYHLVYHNALKKWVENLKRTASIREVEYGCKIPKKYQTALLKSLNER